ncbi:MAG: enoyl-CoA hydratase/isomerase family protein [Dehalococcoidia bacterium]|nr:enoyl-CoA hydratase/isomerase family protein [Dehalococcoidia bacterium]
MDNKVLLEVEGAIATVTLNRPDAINALDSDVFAGLEKAALDITNNPAISVVILTGAGDKAFSPGLDVKAFVAEGGLPTAGRVHRNAADRLTNMGRIFTLYEDLVVPVIAAIHGYCFAGGLELALCCDIRIAAENSLFSLPEVNIGTIPDIGGTQRLPKIIGPGYTKELTYTARRIDAREALRIGLVNHVYPREQLMPEVKKLAQEIAKKHPATIQAAKKAINAGWTQGLKEGIAYETSMACYSVSLAGKPTEAAAGLKKEK